MSTSFDRPAAALARDWWVFLVRGIVAILFGILAFVWPAITLYTLIILFAVFAIADGILSFGRAYTASKQGQKWIWPVVGGVVGVGAGVVALVWPGETALILLYIIAAWAIVVGIVEILAGVALRQEIRGEWLLILGGVISVLFGVLVFVRPGAGALALVWLIGFYAVVLGLDRIALAFRLRDLQAHLADGGTGGMETTPPAAA
jgi:uncharacterized membrane protein HdeD (DUF308 family)